MIELSFIVPVYNVENYLPRCIESILKQNICDFELILIDDGSTDKSGVICDWYAQNQKNIKVIHKKNEGLSEARNCGLSSASGVYILFVDSDDYIDDVSGMLTICSDNKLDLLTGNAVKVGMDHKESLMKKNILNGLKVETGKEILKRELKAQSMEMTACISLYSRTFLLDNGLYFKKGLLHEDEQWTPRVFLSAERAAVSDTVFYHYILRANSITEKKDKAVNAVHVKRIVEELERIYLSQDDIVLQELLLDNLVDKYLNAFYVGKMYRRRYRNWIDKDFVRRNARSGRNRKKVFLFTVSPTLYYMVNYLLKKIIKRIKG